MLILGSFDSLFRRITIPSIAGLRLLNKLQLCRMGEFNSVNQLLNPK